MWNWENADFFSQCFYQVIWLKNNYSKTLQRDGEWRKPSNIALKTHYKIMSFSLVKQKSNRKTDWENSSCHMTQMDDLPVLFQTTKLCVDVLTVT